MRNCEKYRFSLNDKESLQDALTVAKRITNFDAESLKETESEYKILYQKFKEERSNYINATPRERCLNFWGDIYARYREIFPHLLKIVESLLVAQVNSACNEQIFSIRKLICDDRRLRLDNETVEMLLRINTNSCSLNDIEACKAFYSECVEQFHCN